MRTVRRKHIEIAWQAANDAKSMILLRNAGKAVGRKQVSVHGLSECRWAWANAMLVEGGVKRRDGTWRRMSVAEAIDRVEQVYQHCLTHGLGLIRVHNANAKRNDARRSAI